MATDEGIAGSAEAAQEPKKTRIVVEEGGLEFVTPDGRILATLREEPGRGATLTLVDADGGPSVSLGASGAGGAVIAWSRYCRGYATLGADDLGGAVNVGSPEGGRVACVTVIDGSGSVQVGTPDGEAKAYLNAGQDGGMVGINNGSGLQVAALGVHDGDGVAQVLSRAGVRLFVVPAWKSTEPPPA